MKDVGSRLSEWGSGRGPSSPCCNQRGLDAALVAGDTHQDTATVAPESSEKTQKWALVVPVTGGCEQH